MWNDIEIGVIANIITAVIIAALIYVIVRITEWLTKKNFLKFFGITQKNYQISIRVSRIEVNKGGTTNAKNEKPETGFCGPAINQNEYEAALLFQNQIKVFFIPLLPKGVRDWLSGQSTWFQKLDAAITVSPKMNETDYIKKIMSQNVIIIGSYVYNWLAEECTQHRAERLIYFKRVDKYNEVYIKRPQSSPKDPPYHLIKGRSDEPGRELGIIQRLRNENQSRVILCAGTGSGATFGAASYLINNWRQLHDRFGEEDFAICLEFYSIFGTPDEKPPERDNGKEVLCFPDK